MSESKREAKKDKAKTIQKPKEETKTKKEMKAQAHSSPAKVLSCACISRMQDFIHGKHMRAHNPCNGGFGGVMYRCTICSHERSV